MARHLGWYIQQLYKGLGIGTLCLMLGSAAGMGPSAPFMGPIVEGAVLPPTELGGAMLVPTGLGLSGVRLGRYAGAVIDGKWIRQGRVLHDGVILEAVFYDGVLLRYPDGKKQLIKLFDAYKDEVASSPSSEVASK